MAATSTPKIPDIHSLIQQRQFDFYGFIKEYGEQIDNHVEICEQCHRRMIGWTEHLPKLRARMTVEVPDDWQSNYYAQLQKLSPGQCLPCGCEVIEVAWTREQARTEFYKALAEVMEMPEDKAKKIHGRSKLQELPLSTKALRRLRDKFWIPDGSSGSEQIRDSEEGHRVLQLPETIEDFLATILRLHSGMSYRECSMHWCP